MMKSPRALQSFFREPLFRLLAINLAIGIVVAVLLLAGLLFLNPHGLRDLILADRAPITAVLLLLFGFVVTFGSVAMGTAIMALGQSDGGGRDAAAGHTGAGDGVLAAADCGFAAASKLNSARSRPRQVISMVR